MKKPNQPHNKKRLNRILVIILLIPICFYILPKAVFHWSVCEGIQYSGGLVGDVLFSEFCPGEKEQWYENLFWEECIKQDRAVPPYAEVIISACTDPEVRGVPGGEFLFVHEKKTDEIYLLDLRTGEKRQLPPGYKGSIILSSESAWIHGSAVGPGKNGYRSHYVLDLADGQKYELVNLTREFNTILDNGEINPNLFPYFTEAERVFISYERNAIIALAPNFHQNPKRNVYFNQSSLGQGADPENGELLVKLLKELGVDYEVIDFSLRYVEVPSPMGRYVIRNDGIFFLGSDIPVITDEYIPLVYIRAFNGWFYDDSGIISAQPNYFYFPNNFLLEQLNLPRPILKLSLPPE